MRVSLSKKAREKVSETEIVIQREKKRTQSRSGEQREKKGKEE